MDIPNDLRFLATHEWHRREGDICTLGVSKFAADALTDITYVDLPSPGKEVTAGQAFGEIESIKATSDLVSGVSGVVTEVNKRLADEPELVNNDSFGEGWMIKVKITDAATFEKLLTPEAYKAQLGD